MSSPAHAARYCFGMPDVGCMEEQALVTSLSQTLRVQCMRCIRLELKSSFAEQTQQQLC